MIPQVGDVLASNTTATVDYVLSIVPLQGSAVCPNHDAAVAEACVLASERRVDAWLTEDHIHFLRIASYRENPDRADRSTTTDTPARSAAADAPESRQP